MKMTTKLSLSMVVALLINIHVNAQAPSMGDKGGNGGDGVILSNDQVRFLDLVRSPRTTFLDTEKEGLDRQLNEALEKHPSISQATYYPTNFGSAEATKSVKQAILEAFHSLTFKLVTGPIPEVNDRGMVVLPWDMQGSIVRLALQDRSSFTVIVSKSFYDKLPPKDRVALLLHESLIRVWYNDRQNEILSSTEQIASFVHVVMDDKTTSLSSKSVARYLCSAEIMAGEKSNFGARQIVNYRVPNHADASLPHELSTFIYNEGRCDTNFLINDSHLPEIYYGRKIRIYGWTLTDIEENHKVYFNYDVDQLANTPAFIFKWATLQTEKKGGISLHNMRVHQLLKSRLSLWKK